MENPHESTTGTESTDSARGERHTQRDLHAALGAGADVLPGWSEDQVLRRFRDVTEDLGVVLDLEGRVVWANRAAHVLLDFDAELRPRRTFHESVELEDRPRLAAALARIAAQTSAATEHTEVSHAGASAPRRVDWKLHSLRGPGGHLVGYSGCGHDVTDRRLAESRLQKSEARMGAVMTSLLDPMITIDVHGQILTVSDSVERVFGYAPAELVGKNVNVLMPEPHRSAHDGYLAHYRATQETAIIGRTREFEVVRKDGQRIWCGLSVSRADPRDGQEALFTGTFRDVTALKLATRALEESERRFHAIFDGAFQFIGLLSPEGLVLETNQTALDAIGGRREDFLGMHFAETPWWSHSAELQARIRAAIVEAAGGKFVRFEARTVGMDGALRDVDFSLKPVKDDAGRVVLLIPEGRDISDLKRAQRSEVAMLRAFAAIGESAALLAHEIKNPITAVHVALRAVASELGEDHRVILEDLVTRMQRIEQMMRRTLSFTKPLDLKLSPCTASELFCAVREHLQAEIARANGEVRFEVPSEDVRFICDRQLLRDVLANLVTNSLEAKGRDVRVVLQAAHGADGTVVLAVEDDGPGIPASLIDTLFRPFVTTKSRGNGLGLAICRKVVEEHGGTIQAERGRESGARFEIRIPPERKLA